MSDNGILLTIAIPTYNRANILDKALTNLLPQLYQFYSQIEVIISDNASEDSTQSIINKHVNKYKSFNILVHRQQNNLGYFGNFKTCREMSAGKYLWLLSDNEHLRPNAIKVVMNAIYKYNGTGFFYIDVGKFVAERSFAKLVSPNDFLGSTSGYRATLMSSVIFLNDKSYDEYLYKHYDKNLFLGFLFACSALRTAGSICILHFNLYYSYRANVSFDIVRAWTKDISECVNYMIINKLINEEESEIFVTGYLTSNVYRSVISMHAKRQIQGKRYSDLKDIMNEYSKYYNSNMYFKKHFRVFFNNNTLFKYIFAVSTICLWKAKKIKKRMLGI